MAKIYQPNIYNNSPFSNTAANSASVVQGDFVNDTDVSVSKAVAGGVISGLSVSRETFASDNETVAKAKLQYIPTTNIRYVEVKPSADTGTEAGKFYDITSAGLLDVATESDTTGQLRVKKIENGVAICEIVNA